MKPRMNKPDLELMGSQLFCSKPYLTSVAGSLPPSCRRSLFTLATSMILFSSKAYNILPLVHTAKTALADKMVGRSHC